MVFFPLLFMLFIVFVLTSCLLFVYCVIILFKRIFLFALFVSGFVFIAVPCNGLLVV